MTDDLVVFLRTRLDEDAALAEAASGEWDDESARYEWEDLPDASYAHARRHAPSRVLREVDAKRAHLDNYRRVLSAYQQGPVDEKNSLAGYRDACWGTLLADAAIFSDHPGYRQEWKP